MKAFAMKTLALLLLAPLFLAHAACAVTEDGDRCDDSHGTHDLGGCAASTSRWTCAGGEGSYYWTERGCPLGTECIGSDTYGACFGPGEGGACKPETGCMPGLVCDSNVCKRE